MTLPPSRSPPSTRHWPATDGRKTLATIVPAATVVRSLFPVPSFQSRDKDFYGRAPRHGRQVAHRPPIFAHYGSKQFQNLRSPDQPPLPTNLIPGIHFMANHSHRSRSVLLEFQTPSQAPSIDNQPHKSNLWTRAPLLIPPAPPGPAHPHIRHPPKICPLQSSLAPQVPGAAYQPDGRPHGRPPPHPPKASLCLSLFL